MCTVRIRVALPANGRPRVAFSLAVRGYNHVGFLINVPMDKGEAHGVMPARVALHLNRAASYYSIMRTYYFSVSPVLWLFGPLWMLLAAIGLLALLYHLDHLPQQD